LIEYLQDAEAAIMFSEVDETAIKHFRDERGLTFIPPETVYSTECDVISPNALGGVLNAETIPLLRCRIIVGGANNQLATPGDGDLLKERNILFVPDYVVSVGAVIAIPCMERQGWSPEYAEKQVRETVQNSVKRVLQLARQENISTEAAARQIAEERLATAK
jgi:leucine dehydrogenase